MSVSRHTTYNVLGQVLPIALSLVTVPIYLKLVGPDRYGVLAIAWLLLGYFGLFDLGLGRATSFRIAALRDAPGQARADTFLGPPWRLISAWGAIGGFLLWGAAGYFFAHLFKVGTQLRPEIAASVPFLAASVPIATLTGVLTGALQGRERFLELNVISVVSTMLFQIIPLGIAWQFGPNLVPLLCGAVAARLAAAGVLAFRCHTELTRGHRRRLVHGEVPTLLKYGGWVTLTSVFGPVLIIVDRFRDRRPARGFGSDDLLSPLSTCLAGPDHLLWRVDHGPLSPDVEFVRAEERDLLGENATRALTTLISLPVLGAIFLIEPFLSLWVGHRLGVQAGAGRAAASDRLLGQRRFALVPFTRLQASGRPDLVTKVLMAEIPPFLVCLYFGMTYLGLRGAALSFAG